MSLFDKFANRLFKRGQFTIIFADGSRRTYGTADPAVKPVTVRFADKGVARFIASNPHLRAAEAYMDGRLVIEQGDIRDLIDLVRANGRWEDARVTLRGTLTSLVRDRIRARVQSFNSARASKRNVAHHYDLNDRLYDLFLDADRQYSCAYFTGPEVGLDQAQADKKAHIAAKLNLKPGLRVLDIGCGWGGMALYLNRAADVDVLGITLSEEQLKVARQRAEAAGVADRVKFELIDYRALEGRFDRIVSVGMFEHVGVPQYETFFRKCRDLLAEDGVMLLHTIGRLGVPGKTDAFTLKYIFPGGYNPALSEIVSASEPARLIAADVETLRLHYGMTLDHWYDRTMAAKDAIVALYDERFFRMWTFYLAGARAAFIHGNLCNYQIQYIRDRRATPITRDYMREAEKALPR
ncbi:cyclopropane-fatty-acyl-phospholipid synthase [Sphingomonas sp. Root710]|uniref:SAM-dependent methyltransferase n=1 Tax=Sphingomonas sp. Root710 TaxID=1736594 RepID=UPI0006FB7087|nr:cyclopropane-fatty-acyl-phospholipid synthase family protein [Sphingomonas sp. Root710]KRB80744.1 cyclopropane-fatty-acyl-phospholipid synthase [Sphingomonas sp. Root710]